ncbi:hypothetical protein BCV70DRAFT_45278 [Testicularia cyperi]|uniref:Polynucleotide 5'-hydroxyl-kinase GRC3 n=1 Tax=Testicularia cyperi TaxID=1882483 RepID=A0A317XHN3_9BASI|nr:hypothetical protein BCV70DRAFT_45278 [Testicularia cyperi]
MPATKRSAPLSAVAARKARALAASKPTHVADQAHHNVENQDIILLDHDTTDDDNDDNNDPHDEEDDDEEDEEHNDGAASSSASINNDQDAVQAIASLDSDASASSTPRTNSSPRKMRRWGSSATPRSGPSVQIDAASDGERSSAIPTNALATPEPQETLPPTGPTIPYSNFHPDTSKTTPNIVVDASEANDKCADVITVGLRPGQTLTLIGTGRLEVLKGSVQMGGVVLRESSGSSPAIASARIFAPIFHPLPVIKALASKSATSTRSRRTKLDKSLANLPASFAADTFCSIVRLLPLESDITSIANVCTISGVSSPFSPPSNLPLLRFPQLSTLTLLFEPDAASLTAQQQFFLANNIAIPVGLSAIYVPHAWQHAINALSASLINAARDPQEEPVIALVRGAKKVGKSTLSRMALECAMSLGPQIGGQAAFLELDLGQSDFGPPGMVALHVFDVQPGTEISVGPAWCQPRVPARAHFIGDVSPKEDPKSYMDAISDLVQYFCNNVQRSARPAFTSSNRGDDDDDDDKGVPASRVPLIVNTQGWTKGLGADLATRIEALLCPTHIFDVVPRGQFESVPRPIRGPAWLDAEGAILASGPEIVTLESVNQVGFVHGTFSTKATDAQAYSSEDAKHGPGDGGPVPPSYVSEAPTKVTAADVRTLSIMSYLHAQELHDGVEGGAVSDTLWDFGKPLVEVRPLVVDVKHGLAAGIRVLPFGSSIPDSLKLAALNASIVAIVAQQDRGVSKSDNANGTVAQQTGLLAATSWQTAFSRGRANLDVGPDTRCLGLGLVRSIDVEQGHLHLVTPLATSLLARQTRLGVVKGAIELPIWASLDFASARDARQSKLLLPLASSSDEPEPLLAGVPRSRVPYIELPAAPTSHLHHRHHHQHNQQHRGDSNYGSADTQAKQQQQQQQQQQHSTLASLGSQKRKVRRNVMRKSQFA